MEGRIVLTGRNWTFMDACRLRKYISISLYNQKPLSCMTKNTIELVLNIYQTVNMREIKVMSQRNPLRGPPGSNILSLG